MTSLQDLIRKSIVVMPSLHRPEMLAMSLESLSRNNDAENLDVRIFLDTCPDERVEEVTYVRDTYFPTAEIFNAKGHCKVLSGCWNILNSLKCGYESGKEFIFLLEEDVIVKPDFIKLHLAIHGSGDYFVTCGRRHGRMPLDFYSNPGTCYRRESLAKIVPHIHDEFFKDTGAYLDKHFPDQKGLDGLLDDGLIRKVQRSIGGKVLCIDPPVAFHQGFRYYGKLDPWVNRGTTIQERIKILRDMLLKVSPENRYTRDFEPFQI